MWGPFVYWPAGVICITYYVRKSCSSNLRQVGIALHNYHDAYNAFPAAGFYPKGTTASNWSAQARLLDYLEQENLEDLIDWSLPYSAQPQVAKTRVSTFLCPSEVNDQERLDGTFVMFLPKNMKPSTLQREINRAYGKFYSPKQIMRRLIKGDIWCGLKRIAYRYWSWEISRSTKTWIKYLESVEDPYYDETEHLIVERLGEGIHPAQFPGSSLAAGLDRATLAMGGDD